MSRSGLAGPTASMTTGISFGVPPILTFGSKELQERFLPDLLLGKKRTCIAITEPGAGSDVANIHRRRETLYRQRYQEMVRDPGILTMRIAETV